MVTADTLVVRDSQVLGKPDTPADARAVLESLRSRGHDVLTGVALRLGDGRQWAAVVTTRVQMRAYADTEIEAYIARGEPFDKAGGYAIQDAAFAPVARLDGCYLNVVGRCAEGRRAGARWAPMPRPPTRACQFRRLAQLVSISL